MGRPTQPIVLDRHWDVSSLIGETFKLFWRHKLLFLTITAIVVVPTVVLLDVAMSADTFDAESGEFDGTAFLAGMGSLLLFITVVPALVTALHVVSVLRIAEGEAPGVGEALALAGRRAWPAIGASVLYMLCIVVGLVLLIVPGLYLGVRLYFAAQAAVVDGETPGGAITRSAELVKGRWWQTFGRLLLAGIVFGLVVAPLSGVVALLDFGVLYVVLDVIAQTIGLSLTALFGTLVFMDYHGHREAAAEPAGHGGFQPPQPPAPQRFG